VFHLVTHAFFKALLFLGSGSVIYAMHAAYHHTGRPGVTPRTCATWAAQVVHARHVLADVDRPLAIAGVPFSRLLLEGRRSSAVCSFARMESTLGQCVTCWGIPARHFSMALTRSASRPR
jgi:hypothetical protein